MILHNNTLMICCLGSGGWSQLSVLIIKNLGKIWKTSDARSIFVKQSDMEWRIPKSGIRIFSIGILLK